MKVQLKPHGHDVRGYGVVERVPCLFVSGNMSQPIQFLLRFFPRKNFVFEPPLLKRLAGVRAEEDERLVDEDARE